MTFIIPEDLEQFSISSLEDMKRLAQNEYNTLRASVTGETVTNEQLERLEELQEFVFTTVPDLVDKHEYKKNRFSAATTDPEEEEAEVEEKEEPAAVTASATAPETKEAKAPRMADVKKEAGTQEPQIPVTQPQTYSTLIASATVATENGGTYEAGQALASMLDVAKVFQARSAGHQGMFNRGMSTTNSGPVSMPVATLVRNYPAEFSVNGDETDYDKLLAVSSEARLPGGSLLKSVEISRNKLQEEHPERDAIVAAQGWCAPSETDYDICLQITTDGLADWPEVQARRGGIRHNTGIEFDTIFGTCSDPTGYFDLTEAQVAAGTTKTCLEIPCPDFVDTRLGVTGLCLTGNILAIRGYPEFTATFTRGAMAASAHQINREQIADVVTGSTAVNLTAAAPWATDGSTTSQVMSAVEMAIVDIKYRLRMARNSTLEVILPWWVLAQFRADWMRRPFAQDPNLTDSEINNWFSTRGARVQYVYDWQDAFANCAASGSPGADTAINNLPTSLQFLVYPAGTWIRAVSDVITLNSVYDSTKLATNQVTHLFTETGWAMVKMCPVSRVYTVPICPSGKTTSTGTLTCPS